MGQNENDKAPQRSDESYDYARRLTLPREIEVTQIAVTRIVRPGDMYPRELNMRQKQPGPGERTCYTYTGKDCDILHEAAGGGKAHYGPGDSCELCEEADGSWTFTSRLLVG